MHVVVLDDRLVLGFLARLTTDVVDRIHLRRVLPDVIEPYNVLGEGRRVDFDRLDAFLRSGPDEVDNVLGCLSRLGLLPALDVDDLEACVVETGEEFVCARVDRVVDDLHAPRVGRCRSLEGGDALIHEVGLALALDVPDAIGDVRRIREVELGQQELGLAEVETFGTDKHGVVSGSGM